MRKSSTGWQETFVAVPAKRGRLGASKAGESCRCTGYMGQLRAIKAWLLKGGDAV